MHRRPLAHQGYGEQDETRKVPVGVVDDEGDAQGSAPLDERTAEFSYVQPSDPRTPSCGEPIALAPEPSWGRVAPATGGSEFLICR